MKSFLAKLEDPERPLLGPTVRGLQKWKMFRPENSDSSSNTIHILCALFVLSEYLECWFIRSDLELALKNISYTMLSTMCVAKAISFVSWHDQWKQVIEYVSYTEKRQLAKNDRVTNAIIKEYIKYSRIVTYLYWCLVTATVVLVMLTPLFIFLSSNELRERIRNGTAPYPEMFSSWTPFDRTRGLGYGLSILEHSWIAIYGGAIIACYDCNAVVIMSFFTGQMKLLSINCERMFDGVTSQEEAMRRIRQCHNHHVDLIKFSQILNSLLSPVMFLYVIICSLMICGGAIQLTTEGTTNMQRVWITEYLMALIAQLFLYCWHSNEVLYMSNSVEGGVYKSSWWLQNVRVRRCVLLLGGQLRRPILFTAGPFTALNVATFIAILKGSYSYFTLLSQKED